MLKDFSTNIHQVSAQTHGEYSVAKVFPVLIMPQLFSSLPPEYQERILCCYVNGTRKMLIARIANIPNWWFERMIFPEERLLFEAPPNAQLEIHRNTGRGTTLSDSIPCTYLRINEKSTSKTIVLSGKTA